MRISRVVVILSGDARPCGNDIVADGQVTNEARTYQIIDYSHQYTTKKSDVPIEDMTQEAGRTDAAHSSQERVHD